MNDHIKRYCFLCGSSQICWDADFDGEDERGIIHDFHCMDCGSRIRILEFLNKVDVNENE